MTTSTAVCAACGSPRLRPHCERKMTQCRWWRCRDCGSFGNATNHVRMGGKKR